MVATQFTLAALQLFLKQRQGVVNPSYSLVGSGQVSHDAKRFSVVVALLGPEQFQ
jgi:hypothetical protein